ncbi:hypothetical protein ACJX0J_016344, partial [Zea mays]
MTHSGILWSQCELHILAEEKDKSPICNWDSRTFKMVFYTNLDPLGDSAKADNKALKQDLLIVENVFVIWYNNMMHIIEGSYHHYLLHFTPYNFEDGVLLLVWDLSFLHAKTLNEEFDFEEDWFTEKREDIKEIIQRPIKEYDALTRRLNQVFDAIRFDEKDEEVTEVIIQDERPRGLGG